MNTTYNVSGSRKTIASTRLGLSLFNRCWGALLERRNRERLRADLCYLSDSELRDMGITRGEIDYVVSNRSIDPRGVRSAG